MDYIPAEFLVGIAVAVLRQGVTPDEAEQMVDVLIAKQNKVDIASVCVAEAQKRLRPGFVS